RGFGREALVGIDRDGARRELEQRQVVVRVAVAGDLAEVRKALCLRPEPLAEALHLALAETRRPSDAARVASVLQLGLGGDQVAHAELASDRGGDEAVGGGDDRAE